MDFDSIAHLALTTVFVGLAAWMFSAWLKRGAPLPEELGKTALVTVLTSGLRCDDWCTTGPFTRVTLYDNLLVIRSLGSKFLIAPQDLADAPSRKGRWLLLPVHHEGRNKVIKLLTDDTRLINSLSEWRRVEQSAAAGVAGSAAEQ